MLSNIIFLQMSLGGTFTDPEIVKKVIGSHKIIGKIGRTSAYTRYQYMLEAFKENPQYIWSVRGGFDISSVLYLLEKNHIQPPSKSIIVGFSDVTILHLWLRKNKRPSVHGVMPYFNKQVFKMHHRLDNKNTEFTFNPLAQKSHKLSVLYNPRNIKQAISTVIGGNLTCLHSQLGTPTQLQGENQIIFMECCQYNSLEVVKKLLQGLIKAKTFDHAAGVFLGDFPHVKEIAKFLHESFPDLWIVHSPKFGHGAYNNFLPMGFETVMNLDNGVISFNDEKLFPYVPKKIVKPKKNVLEKIDIYDLISLNGQYQVHFKGILTLPYVEVKEQFLRHIVNCVRADNFVKVVRVDKNIIKDEEKEFCEKELKDVCQIEIKWV